MSEAAVKRTFYCKECEARFHVKHSRCPNPDCKAWNTIAEGVPDTMSTVVVKMTDIDPECGHEVSTGMSEMDAVLSGGTQPGQVILIAGPPGAGKSTLILEIADAMTKKGVLELESGKEHKRKKNQCLYVTTEEDIEKIRSRSLRLKRGEKLLLCHNKEVSAIESDFVEYSPQYGIVDSLSRMQGSNTVQGRVDNLSRLYDFAHATKLTLFVTAHVNKEETVAGSTELEHTADTILMLNRDQLDSDVRVIRVQKNRHGSEEPVGLFEMTEAGIWPFDPTKNIDTKKIHAGQVFGIATMGGKGLVVEVQALVTPSGKPTIHVLGYETARVRTIVATLAERANVKLFDSDVYVSVLGGINFTDPGLDAAIAMAITSASTKRVVKPMTVFAGEVDLLGRVKRGKLEQRKELAERFGFELLWEDELKDLIGVLK